MLLGMQWLLLLRKMRSFVPISPQKQCWIKADKQLCALSPFSSSFLFRLL
jgi:hypothetical protein